MGFGYLSYSRAAKALMSLCICADLPEPSLLAYTKYGCRLRLRPKFRHIAPLETAARACIVGFYPYAISTKL